MVTSFSRWLSTSVSHDSTPDKIRGTVSGWLERKNRILSCRRSPALHREARGFNCCTLYDVSGEHDGSRLPESKLPASYLHLTARRTAEGGEALLLPCPNFSLEGDEEIDDVECMRNPGKTLAATNRFLRDSALRRKILTHNAAASARIEGVQNAFVRAERIAALLLLPSKTAKRPTHRP